MREGAFPAVFEAGRKGSVILERQQDHKLVKSSYGGMAMLDGIVNGYNWFLAILQKEEKYSLARVRLSQVTLSYTSPPLWRRSTVVNLLCVVGVS